MNGGWGEAVGAAASGILSYLSGETRLGHRLRRHRVKPLYRRVKTVTYPFGIPNFGWVSEHIGHYCTTCQKRVGKIKEPKFKTVSYEYYLHTKRAWLKISKIMRGY